MNRTSVKIILGFSGIIFAGSMIIFFFGFSENTAGKSWLNAIFTSISGVCVTGLSVIDISNQLNLTGQVTLLVLIQLGGLGVLTISNWLSLSFRKRLNILQFDSTNKTLGYLYNLPESEYIKQIILFTFLAEGIGAVLLFFCFIADYGASEALWLAVFHSISAFCNAGFSLFSNNFEQYGNNLPANLVIIFLIFLGGIGFIVNTDIFQFVKSYFIGQRRRLSLQSKISLSASLWLIISGLILIYVFEFKNSLKPDSYFSGFLKSLFLSVSSRTAGFNTIPTSDLNGTTLLLLIFLMIIGASAGSTGGGIKTSTAVVLWAHIKSIFRKRDDAEIFYRRISPQDISKSITVFVGYLIIMFLAVIFIQVFETFGKNSIESRRFFLDHLFEVVSALSTVGLSTGITPNLGSGGKIILMMCMFIGRVGLLALISSVLGKQKRLSYQYPVEKIMVG